MTATLLINTVLVALGATAGALLLGLIAALGVLAMPGRARLPALAIPALTLALPPFLLTAVWLQILGNSGPWNSGAVINLYSRTGASMLLALWLWPIPCLSLLAGWSQINSRIYEQDGLARGWTLWKSMILPLSWPALRPALLITLVLAANQFTIPAILQIKVLPAEAWITFSTGFNIAQTAAVSWPMLVIPLILMRLGGNIWNVETIAGAQDNLNALAARGCRQNRGWMHLGLVVIGTVALLLPLAGLIQGTRSIEEFLAACKSSSSATLQSFLQAAIPASLATGTALLWNRKFNHKGIWAMLQLIPGFFAGLLFIWLFNRPGFSWLYPSTLLVVTALWLRYTLWPLLMLGFQGTTAQGRGFQVEAARLDGAGGWLLFSRIEWPGLRTSFAAAWFVVYLLLLWDVETSLLIVPPGGETLALRSFHLLHYGHNSQVNAMGLMLLGLAVLPLPVLFLWRSLGNPMRSRLRLAALALAAIPISGCEKPTGLDASVQSKFFSTVDVIGQRGTGPGQFNKPRSLALDREDNLYVVDMTGRVQKFSSSGKFLLFWDMEQSDKGKAKGMIGAADTGIWIVEPHYSRVTQYGADGRKIRSWGSDGTNSGQLAFPRAIARGSSNELFVSEYSRVERVQKFSPDGSQWLATYGKPGAAAGEFNRAEGIGFSPSGQLFVADSCNHRVQVLDASGRAIAAFGSAGREPGQMSYPYDVRVDGSGNVFVCEFGNSRVQIFDAAWRTLEILGGDETPCGRMNNPWALALDSRGNLYVADSLNHRVLKFNRRTGNANTSAGNGSLNPGGARS